MLVILRGAVNYAVFVSHRCALQVVASAIVDKYIGESARVVREMFGYAKVRGVSLIV